jgi:hypothetical protein
MREVRRWLFSRAIAAVCGAWLLVLGSGELLAQEKPREQASNKHSADSKKAAPKKTPGGMNVAREAAALAFVHEHHPELESLLASLKERQPKQYEAAIRDLFRHSERLAGYQEKDASRYELELKSWKLQSRVQLLSATVLMSPQDAAAKAKLKEALVEQLRARRELLALERQQVAKRLKKLDEQLEKLNREVDLTAESQLQAILAGQRANGKPNPKAAPKSTTPTAIKPSR